MTPAEPEQFADTERHYLAAQVLAPWGWAIRCACEWHSTGATSSDEATQMFEEHLQLIDGGER